MKKILRSSLILAASIGSMLPFPLSKVEPVRQKKQRGPTAPGAPQNVPVASGDAGRDWIAGRIRLLADNPLWNEFAKANTGVSVLRTAFRPARVQLAERYPWRQDIVTTTFWIGEDAAKNNPVPNRASSWDPIWVRHYGGTDPSDPRERVDYRPAAFEPGQNPFYVALPYNDVQQGRHKPESEKIIPWFNEEYRQPGKSVCKGRWIAIRRNGRVAYAQWEDCGPFRTDHSGYVFGNERPKYNLNKGAGLDVSPAVRDYLGMNSTDVTDWKFVDFDEVPDGPWTKYGDNNTFVINRRLDARRIAALEEDRLPLE